MHNAHRTLSKVHRHKAGQQSTGQQPNYLSIKLIPTLSGAAIREGSVVHCEMISVIGGQARAQRGNVPS